MSRNKFMWSPGDVGIVKAEEIQSARETLAAEAAAGPSDDEKPESGERKIGDAGQS